MALGVAALSMASSTVKIPISPITNALPAAAANRAAQQVTLINYFLRTYLIHSTGGTNVTREAIFLSAYKTKRILTKYSRTIFRTWFDET